MKFLVVVETTPTGFSAFSPDVLGCVATGETKREVEKNMREALEFHLEGMALDNETLPPAQTYITEVEVSPA